MKKLLFFPLFTLVFLLVSCSGRSGDEQKQVELIQLSQMSIILYEGQSYQVVSTITPADAVNKDLKWTVSSSGVCKVENGLITALSPGVCTVTAKAENGKSAGIKVVVKSFEEIKSIHFPNLAVSLDIGGVDTLVPIFSPSSASSAFPISWSSSNENVAIVGTDGRVTAIGEGNCFIFADLAISDNMVRAVCEVKVGDHEADLSALADIYVKDIPAVFECKDAEGSVITRAEFTSYEIERTLGLDREGRPVVTIRLSIKGKKIFDADGDDAENFVSIVTDLYMEDDTHCETRVFESDPCAVGEDITIELSFNALIKTYQRHYYVVLSEVSEE